MKVHYTQQSLDAFEELKTFLKTSISEKKTNEIILKLIGRCEKLSKNPLVGRKEKYLEHLGLDHRRIIEKHIKIIYRIYNNRIYIIDIFDSRQDPVKMKG
jgi:plasmid stabilization system protein ParE